MGARKFAATNRMPATNTKEDATILLGITRPSPLINPTFILFGLSRSCQAFGE
ncbi:hypothetical protein GMES_3364 [Paraglaciecola mesophila KMM 241]|uniref:Uncharacterized protein n=1 Tax=Paraglaciecola mesophila KMM 241 TaxID=1128912 RepID=K6YNR3_9ALTE|nr:hypothetical protein GMES_3364 [Paraglaciecola mesophila KMM 241]